MTRWWYSVLFVAVLPIIFLRLLYRSIKQPDYRKRLGERFGFYRSKASKGGVWVHSVSVGESLVAIKIVKQLLQINPAKPVTMTCTTPTASIIIRQHLGERVHHVYVPYDLPFLVTRFLKYCQPSVGIIVEKELWPNLLLLAKEQGVSMMGANILMSERSFGRYHWISGLIKQSLQSFTCLAVQTKEDSRRLIALGADENCVHVVGNIKFEFDVPNVQTKKHQKQLHEKIAQQRMAWLAGSTHNEEEGMVLDVHAKLLRQNPELLLILVPRHPERFESVYSLCQSKFNTQRLSTLRPEQNLGQDVQVLLIDSMGVMERFIAVSDWCFIGGSLVPIGGHNLLEVCNQGVPVIYGPHMHNTLEIAQLVKNHKAGFEVQDTKELLTMSQSLLENQHLRIQIGINAKSLIAKYQGVLSRTLALFGLNKP